MQVSVQMHSVEVGTSYGSFISFIHEIFCNGFEKRLWLYQLNATVFSYIWRIDIGF